MARDVQNRPQDPHPQQPNLRRMSASQRQRAYKRMRRQKRRQLLFYILAFLAVVIVAIVLCLTVLFKITSIEVSGTTRYKAADIIQTSGLHKGENLFLVDTNDAEQKIQKNFPYLSEVKVSRRLPARVTIAVKDASVACVADWNGKFLLLDSTGKVLEIATQASGDVPVCKGLKVKSATVGNTVSLSDQNQLKLFSQVAQAVKDSSLSTTTSIDISDPYDLKVICKNKAGNQMTLKLGNSNYLSKKLRFAKATLDQKLSDSQAGTFDLSLVTQEKSLTFFSLDPVPDSSTPSDASDESQSASSAEESTFSD